MRSKPSIWLQAKTFRRVLTKKTVCEVYFASMKSVVFYPRSVAQTLQPTGSEVIVSIHDRSQEPAALQDGWKDILRLSFHDMDVVKKDYDLFNEDQAREVIAFIEKHVDAERIVVHCNMGVSRSAAVAMFISDQQERNLFQQGRAFFHPDLPAQYNRLVYSTLNRTLWGSAPSAFEALPENS